MDLLAYFSDILLVAILVIAVAYFLSSYKHNKTYEKLSKTSTFHCLKCDSVYVSLSGEKSKVCPKCGYRNTQMKF